MGSDDRFLKRKPRTTASLGRLKHARASAERYLIVCEGTKTEPRYFQALVNAQGINSQRVKIAPNNGNTPDKIVGHALHLYEGDYKNGDPFDAVYCVFDRDTHSTFEAAIETIKKLNLDDKKRKKLNVGGKPKELKEDEDTFNAITSTPCFEYWLLLHFEFTDKAFTAIGKTSAGDAVAKALKVHMPHYAKGQLDIHAEVQSRAETALKHAKRARKNAEKTGSTNPTTDVDKLVETLMKKDTQYAV